MVGRTRRIRFVGGVWNGQVREVRNPPYPTLVVPVPIRSFAMGGAEIPDTMLSPTDTYHLERVMDRTRIPELVYRLRGMTR